MNSAPRVLITGSSGFIGNHLCQILKEYDIDFTRLVRTSHSLINSDQISTSRIPNLIELSWPEHLTSLDLSPYSSIVHLAHAQIKQTMSKEELYASHIKPVEILIERIKESNPQCHFIFISSQSADPDSNSKYAQIKFAIEKILEKSEIAFTIIRPGLVYGVT
jgi:nucleoside-diphosphate-sugar epimerase